MTRITAGTLALAMALLPMSAPASMQAPQPAPAAQPPEAQPAPDAPPAAAADPAPQPQPSPPPQEGWDEPQPPPASSPSPAQAAPPAPDSGTPPPPAADAPPRRSSRAGDGLVTTGAVLVAVGGASLLFVALPSAIVKSIALDRAERDPLIAASSREDRYRRARRADDAMEGGFWVGVGALGVGIPLLITGAVLRSRARSEVARRLDVDASGVTVRF